MEKNHPLHRESMSVNLFGNTLKFIRFENQSTSSERLQNDKASQLVIYDITRFFIAKS